MRFTHMSVMQLAYVDGYVRDGLNVMRQVDTSRVPSLSGQPSLILKVKEVQASAKASGQKAHSDRFLLHNLSTRRIHSDPPRLRNRDVRFVRGQTGVV